MKSCVDFFNRNYRVFLALAIIAAMVHAFHLKQFLVDDAFISFRYAKNLADGHGLVWNIGERVEGYSNFLWMLLFALGFKLGLKPEMITLILAIPLHLICLIFVHSIALKIFKNQSLALIALLLVGFNHSISGFASSGLETPLFLCEHLLVIYLFCVCLEKGWTVSLLLLLSILLNLTLLTRPDGAILIALTTTAWFLTHRNKRFTDYAVFIVPFLVIVLPWLIWKQTYYGSIFPNTFNAKVQGLSGIGFGVFYMYLFVLYYTLAPFLLILIFKAQPLLRGKPILIFLGILSLVWIVYTVYVGGDFMEFRFLAPVIPAIIILILAALLEFTLDKRVFAALVIALCLGTFNNFSFMTMRFYSYRVERVESLRSHLYAAPENWFAIGHRFKELFGGTDVKLGIGAAGAIPFYSELPAIDFMGLTDKTIPKIAEPFSSMAGHRLIAPLEYLVNNDVNLIIQPIQLMFPEPSFHRFQRLATWQDIYRFFMDVDNPVNGKYVDEVQLIGIPIEHGFYLVVWYLNRHDAIERAIADHGLKRIFIRRS